MAKLGGLLNLEAICSKLKTNLETHHSNSADPRQDIESAKTEKLSDPSNLAQKEEVEVKNNSTVNNNGNLKTFEPNNNNSTSPKVGCSPEADEVMDLSKGSAVVQTKESDDAKAGTFDKQQHAECADDLSVPHIPITVSHIDETTSNAGCSGDTIDAAEELSSNIRQDSDILDPIMSSTPSVKLDCPSTGRKNRRKNFHPRNINQMSDEGKEAVRLTAEEGLAEYQLNNPDVDFDSVCEDSVVEGDMESINAELSITPDHSEQHDIPFSKDVVGDDCTPLDLSITKSSPTNSSGFSETYDQQMMQRESCQEEALDMSVSPAKSSNSWSASSSVTKPSGTSTNSLNSEAAAMKDYAESTMNELLGMYGLEENDSVTCRNSGIADHVPIQNFQSQSILRRDQTKMNPEAQGTPDSQPDPVGSLELQEKAKRSLESTVGSARWKRESSPQGRLPSGAEPGPSKAPPGKQLFLSVMSLKLLPPSVLNLYDYSTVYYCS